MLKKLIISINLGIFLAFKQIRGSSFWTTTLIVFVMTLTFLNLVVVRGIFVGLVQGVVNANQGYYTGDVIISDLQKKEYIENTPFVLGVIQSLPWVQSFSARYLQVGVVEGTYKERISYTDAPNETNALIVGIDPTKENQTTHISEKMSEGSFLNEHDTDSIMLGGNLLKSYLLIQSPGLVTLENVTVGSIVRVTVGGNTREMTVKGVVKTKDGELDQRVYMLDSTLRTMIGRTDYNVDEIAIKLKPNTDPILVKNAILATPVSGLAKVQTSEEARPKFLQDVKATFTLLGNIIGSIGIIVASITIFIIIYINAINRRKSIGILKGIGINSTAIEVSYVLQSIFYALLGIFFGAAIVYGILVPFMAVHTINFSFSDGVLVAEYADTAMRAALLVLATVVAGYIPAHLVVRQNTLDAILGK